MPAHDAFQVNSPHVIYENIDGELVLIHMRKGSYYSTDPVGAQLWELVVAGCSVAEMQASMDARYAGDAAEIARTVAEFLSELQREELVISQPASHRNGRTAPPPTAEKTPFQAPVLSKYRDMEDMLLLDPIHEVQEAGWPAPKSPDDSEVSEAGSPD